MKIITTTNSFYCIIAVNLIALLSSCAPQRQSLREPPFEITFEKSNPRQIEKSVQGLNIFNFIRDYIHSNDKLIIQSIEENQLFNSSTELSPKLVSAHQLDRGMRAMIEDNIIGIFLKNSCRVYERDPDMILNMIDEESDSYKFKEVIGLKAYCLNDTTASSVLNCNVFTFRHTKLSSADKIFSYRVIECGIYYKKIPYDNKNSERLAFTRLQCRLTDAKTGEILTTGIIENEAKDVVPNTAIKDLEGILYNFYDFTSPNTSETRFQDNKNIQIRYFWKTLLKK